MTLYWRMRDSYITPISLDDEEFYIKDHIKLCTKKVEGVYADNSHSRFSFHTDEAAGKLNTLP